MDLGEKVRTWYPRNEHSQRRDHLQLEHGLHWSEVEAKGR
jgi:hypothetical protein